MPLVYKLKTSDYFQIEQAPIDDTEEETWPPFRKVLFKELRIILIIIFFSLDGSL
jgi:hypothetical protein